MFFPDLKPGVVLYGQEDVNQSNVGLLGLGTDRRNPDVPALAEMNEILAEGLPAGCSRRFGPRRALAYAVGGGLSFAYDHPATFHVMVLTQSANTVEATSLRWQRLTADHTALYEEELARARTTFSTRFLSLRHREKVLAERERLEFYGYPADYLESYKAALEKVTLAEPRPGGKEVHPSRTSWPCWWWAMGRRSSRGLDELKLGPVETVRYHHPHAQAQAQAAVSH